MTGTRRSSRGSARSVPRDDLPGFFASPPGTPRPASGEPAVPRRRGRGLGVGAAAVLVAGAVVTAAVLGTRHPSSAPAAPPSPDRADVEARLTAAGVVLAQAPVGVTAGFPTVSVSRAGDRAVLHLDLPVANCLTTTAPVRPEDGGCQPVAREFGDLATPALRTTSQGDRLTVSGHVPTYVRADGGPPVPTGRVLDVTVAIDPHQPSVGGSVTIGDRTAPALPSLAAQRPVPVGGAG